MAPSSLAINFFTPFNEERRNEREIQGNMLKCTLFRRMSESVPPLAECLDPLARTPRHLTVEAFNFNSLSSEDRSC